MFFKALSYILELKNYPLFYLRRTLIYLFFGKKRLRPCFFLLRLMKEIKILQNL